MYYCYVMIVNLYKFLLRPLLFSLPPEVAQKLADTLMVREFIWRFTSPFFQVMDDRLQVKIAGINLSNPVGLAAGYDKDCRFISSIMNLGFGYSVGGTVTLNPRSGNPRPRLRRLASDKAILNSLGFPSQGLEYAARQLERFVFVDKPILVSVAGLSVDEYVQCHRRLEPLVSGVELNISSPNTQGIKAFQDPELFKELIDKVNEARKKPLFVKLPPYGGDTQMKERVLRLANLCVDSDVDGVTAVNTRPTEDKRLKVGSGGLSGKPIFDDMLTSVAQIRRECGNRLAINACGGIFSAEYAWKAFEAGADSLQLFTGLIYEGPTVARNINKGLLRILDEKGLNSLQEYLAKKSN